MFLKDINPRKPAPGPDHGILIKGAQNLGSRLWWEQLKSAHHGGARRFHALQHQPAEWREDDHGNPLWFDAQFASSTTSTQLIPACRPPSRAKPRHLDHFKLLCHAEAFVDAVKRGIRDGVI